MQAQKEQNGQEKTKKNYFYFSNWKINWEKREKKKKQGGGGDTDVVNFRRYLGKVS